MKSYIEACAYRPEVKKAGFGDGRYFVVRLTRRFGTALRRMQRFLGPRKSRCGQQVQKFRIGLSDALVARGIEIVGE